MADDCARSLWVAVLAHGLADVAAGKDVAWLSSPGFERVCVMAGFDPDEVREQFDAERFRTLTRAA